MSQQLNKLNLDDVSASSTVRSNSFQFSRDYPPPFSNFEAQRID